MFDADTLNALEDGAAVERWESSGVSVATVGAGNNATYGSSAPKLAKNSLNGKSAVRFSAAEKTALGCPGSGMASHRIAGKDDASIVVVFRTEADGTGSAATYASGAGIVSSLPGQANKDEASIAFCEGGFVKAGIGTANGTAGSVARLQDAKPALLNDGMPHVAVLSVSKTDGKMSLMVDGRCSETTTQIVNPRAAANLMFGVMKTNPGTSNDRQHFTGDIAMVRLYDRALTRDEMQAATQAACAAYGVRPIAKTGAGWAGAQGGLGATNVSVSSGATLRLPAAVEHPYAVAEGCVFACEGTVEGTLALSDGAVVNVGDAPFAVEKLVATGNIILDVTDAGWNRTVLTFGEADLSASRCGVRALLLQDRDMLGGCNSSEVRVGLGGRINCGEYPNLGRIVGEIQPIFGHGTPLPGSYYEDDRKLAAFSLRRLYGKHVKGCEPRLELGKYVYAVETNAAREITSVIAQDVRTGERTRYRARLFCDATGDAVLARMAGCETMYGRESRSKWNEQSAPVKADRQVMGLSVQWLAGDAETEQPFPDISAWALGFDEETANYRTCGSWEQEFGQYRDMADDAERIRDWGLYAIFSNWHFVKNRSPRKAEFAKKRFTWISPVGGKRESYRVVGDVVLTQNDMENHVQYPDATATMTWSTDLHFPDPRLAGKFPEPVRSAAYHRGFGGEYPVPYRCLYAKDSPNLFLSGRHISCSHVAFAAVRVMRTLGMLGEVVGMASAICTKRSALPRDVYEKHLDELKEMMKAGVPELPQFHGYHEGWEEKYDFNYRGWVHVYPSMIPKELSKEQMEDLDALGYLHRNEHKSRQDCRRRLILADESRGKLHYYDSYNTWATYSIPVRKPVWDLKRVGDMRYRIVCWRGFQVVDMKARKVVEHFSHPLLDEITAVCDLKDGGFVASVNPIEGPDKGKAVLLHRFDKERKLVATYRVEGLFYARSMQWDRDGETLLLSWEKGFVRLRLPEGKDGNCMIISDFRQPAGRNLFDVIPEKNGDGYLAGCGYGGGLVRFNADGKAVRSWFVPTDTGKESRFYAQVKEMPNGNIYMAHWTGHGKDDSYKGWQAVEFDPQGKVIWHLDSPDRFGSISGIDVLEGK